MSATTEPTERSISAAIRAIVIPPAIRPNADACRKMFEILSTVKK